MAGMIYEFMDGLKEETRLYKELTTSATEKKSYIIKGELEKISEFNMNEEKLVSQIKRLEKKRVELMDDMAMILNLDAKTITITQIEQALKNQEDEAKALSYIKNEMMVAITALRDINAENMELINQSLDYAKFSINVLQSTMNEAPLNANYTKNSENISNSFFDAKQ